jgi:hypothetical protein
MFISVFIDEPPDHPDRPLNQPGASCSRRSFCRRGDAAHGAEGAELDLIRPAEDENLEIRPLPADACSTAGLADHRLISASGGERLFLVALESSADDDKVSGAAAAAHRQKPTFGRRSRHVNIAQPLRGDLSARAPPVCQDIHRPVRHGSAAPSTQRRVGSFEKVT